jgi:hypothetical protein
MIHNYKTGYVNISSRGVLVGYAGRRGIRTEQP